MAADDLALCVAWSSAAMVLIMQDKYILVVNEKGFQLSAPSLCREVIENANVASPGENELMN